MGDIMKRALLYIWNLVKFASAQWRDLFSQVVIDRLLKPTTTAGAGLYLAGVVACLGGVGVWVSQGMARFGQAVPRDVALNIGTYAFAIVFTSIGDLFLEKETNRFVQFTLFLVALAALAGCLWMTYSQVFLRGTAETLGWSVVFSVMWPVWLAWWLINGVDKRFSMTSAAVAAMGNDAGQNLG